MRQILAKKKKATLKRKLKEEGRNGGRDEKAVNRKKE